MIKRCLIKDPAEAGDSAVRWFEALAVGVLALFTVWFVTGGWTVLVALMLS